MATQERKRSVATQTGLYVVVITAIAIVINVLSSGAFGRIDTTYSKRFTLSVGSGRMVRNLKEPIQPHGTYTNTFATLFLFDLETIYCGSPDRSNQHHQEANHETTIDQATSHLLSSYHNHDHDH